MTSPGGGSWFAQAEAGVRFEWGLTGATMLEAHGGCLFVVDVLSFTTAVTIAVNRGSAVYPFAEDDAGAKRFAARHHAELAVHRTATSSERQWSLSPAALARASAPPRLVLPSPNGSTIAAASRGTVLAACLRNATAAAKWAVVRSFGSPQRPAVVIAAGERWPDGSLRPALEDLLGAGAVIQALRAAGCPCSAEALAAANTFAATADVAGAVRSCSSGRELASAGFDEDVVIAAEVDVDVVVPTLRNGAFAASL